ncbi:hypothetical protein SCLCIDRAFT_1223931 [Scleroderma citrinum Foug A]|uniref:Uncharacterized protein n=1 Tax=Scleroderma citrinum Foug A TaxID=1036808 RepID=A0A0C3D767_9AGAM|nr:hypothetical protein SCLCIDRAFT_1223931 [Scleroderma citrinum Foug A]
MAYRYNPRSFLFPNITRSRCRHPPFGLHGSGTRNFRVRLLEVPIPTTFLPRVQLRHPGPEYARFGGPHMIECLIRTSTSYAYLFSINSCVFPRRPAG